jgi:NAD(P)-dependent dehydrogenase (short-subunit alcohol dehydrogenase family)
MQTSFPSAPPADPAAVPPGDDAVGLLPPGAGRLAGKVALITGAGSVGPGWGNGRAMAALFAREGAQVFGLDRDAGRLEETARRVAEVGGTMESAGCDVTSGDAVAAAVAACLARFGRIDVLVNNVGGSARGGPVEMDEAVWDAQVDHNLKSVFLLCKHVLPQMERQAAEGGGAGGGSIVNISSTSGLRWTGAAQVAYAATKAGVIQFSRVLAVQYAARRIRSNTVVPGQLHTPMVEARLAGQRAGGDVDALLAQRQSRIPLPFMGDGRDTAHAALFLASDESRFVTGTEIVVDGGMSVRCG